jgi:nucleoside-diphosphate-sugar epimerase
MRIFLTGATGFIGSALLQELLQAGHRVTGLARSDASAARLAAAGAEVVTGSLDDHDVLGRAAAASEGVIHLAHDHDFIQVRRDVAAAQDLAAITAMGTALAGTGHPFIITSGTAAPTEAEDGPPGYPRYPSEQATLTLAARNVRSMVIRLPPTVHGAGDLTGFIPRLFALAQQKGVSAWVGEGQNTWPSVHRLDAAHLFRLAMEKGQPGSRFHAVQDEALPTRSIAEAIGRRLGLPSASLAARQAADHFGFLAPILAHDIKATSHATREKLGWQPTHQGLLQDIDQMPFAVDQVGG